MSQPTAPAGPDGEDSRTDSLDTLLIVIDVPGEQPPPAPEQPS